MAADLDISWIENEDLYKNREPLDEIAIHYIYINSENAIEKVDCEIEPLNDSRITKERLLQLVQTKRHASQKKYRLNDISLFQFPIEYDQLATTEDISSGFTSVPVFNEICLEPALFIFHEITTIYFFFSEAITPGKSAVLRKDENRITKKVRIHIPEQYLNHKKKSIKRFFMKRAKKTLKNAPL